MGIFTIIFLWPFMVLAAGLVFVVFGDLFDSGGFFPFRLFFSFPALVVFVVALLMIRSRAAKLAQESGQEVSVYQMYMIRRAMLIFSIAILFPTFIRYLVDSMDKNLAVIILALLLAFSFIVWGIFAKSHTTIMYGNIIGGAIALFYLYIQLWDLGEGPRIIAAAFGLAVAVAVSIIKLRERTT
ncbi:MAG: hypothetical protein Q8P77_01950 [Candidatus Veblenbacteria bacterium]|nr:hypothetical protein [Candidatus Veblenbacteria bacterium]